MLPRCGMVFQSYALFPWKTVRGNIEFGPAMKGVAKRKCRKKADQLINSVGLQGFESAYPNQLSGGMRQRVALARVLANEPEVMLCDEPFTALDAMTRQILQDELLRIVQQTGQTVVFVTHSIDESLILSDTIVVMSARPGRIKTMIQNGRPRPRRVDVHLSTDYIDMKKTIMERGGRGGAGVVAANTAPMTARQTTLPQRASVLCAARHCVIN